MTLFWRADHRVKRTIGRIVSISIQGQIVMANRVSGAIARQRSIRGQVAIVGAGRSEVGRVPDKSVMAIAIPWT